MQQHLLPEASTGRDGERRADWLSSLRVRGGNEFAVCCCLVCIFIPTFFILISCSVLEPNQFGIRYNTLTKSIYADVEHGGLHLTGLLVGFIQFPAAQKTLQFSSAYGSDRPHIVSRTGNDPSDPDSGGQPISISCAVQYSFQQETLVEVYKNFGGYEGAKQRYLLLAGNKVSNTAQRFTPQDFWTNRPKIAQTMLDEVNKTLWADGRVIAHRFEILRIDFAQKYEDTITATQVAQQRKVINEYDQKVTEVVQSIEVMKSENNAKIANISSGAQADAKEIAASATRDAFRLKQKQKASAVASFRDALNLTNDQVLQYLKIRAFVGQEKNGDVTVGIPSVGAKTKPVKADL